MAGSTPSLDKIVALLRRLPGIGPRSAQRIALDLLLRKRELMPQLALALQQAHQAIRHCERCNNLCEDALCSICSSGRRDRTILCIVESPADLLAIEDSAAYQGEYFVLMGHLSPLDGIGPDALHLDLLEKRLAEEGLQEVIFATNSTLEGEATAQFVAALVPEGLRVTRIARGIPMGGELEYLDRSTLGRAVQGRAALES
ncbi:recombination protein RecR [Acidithiobacillus sp. CV18-2]|uniref:Recombination protein RecR n=1 Tax=Igneacidithiobacillus copahuensis TaxID=2724909 RepID=A0AAE2YRY6_9PROT|nr:recombination mediator RecR [Igneacidithiobacillus copahuensis]MBU2753881.1 recombination protein RecR [Acidithiobacillus sp. CV18-3]MBU2757421.1 recombination protein RecR [Acidithiobacillus sp. BN09-2]MBU2777307.1 recombination protein RecR [Acidithiobacillus sp. CV18-2]MBU2796210.1 recombination protein RecR [Acidithiobacillus sp. VAN18-2]MBU2798411.1 recombination protein RecR [Acidithiobacillus sp. VAN18-4]UTV82184.1 recombination mediator RecR [Acidithiobacillus sp. YTS05]